MTSFVDRVVLHVAGGDGGNGCASVHREKFKPLGGPDGANGGKGGDVVLVVDASTTTLLEYHHSPHRSAGKGAPGEGALRHGRSGGDLELRVPSGTIVKDADGEVLADLVGAGTRFVVAQGGRGGLGNAALASARRKAPGFALLGEPGDALDVTLELKSVADVALVGFPTAGKSSLIAVLSAARPKIADYPFTTLVPNLGVVQAGDTRFTVADVPGLIPGASEGKGLGLEFLRHVERCAALVHVLDCATLEPDRDPITDLDVIEAELAAYPVDPDLTGTAVPLTERPRIVALNKVDIPEGRELAELVRPELEERGYEVVEVSATARDGLRELMFAMARLVQEARDAAPSQEATRIVLRPTAVDDAGLHRHPRAGPHRARAAPVPDPRREARALGAPDRLQQRRGRRLPRRPAGAAGRRGGAVRGRCRRRLHGPDRPARRRGRVRLGAHPRRWRRAARRPPRHRPAARGAEPGQPRRAPRAARRAPGGDGRGTRRACRRARAPGRWTAPDED